MFSHLVSAARGLFANSNSSHHSSGSSKQEKPDSEAMVTTRRSILSQVEDSSPSRDSSPATNGKRKTVSSVTELTFEPTPKRRRGQANKEIDSQASTPQPNGVKKRPYKILEAVEIRSNGSTRESSIVTPTTNTEEAPHKLASKPNTTHVRFGSEEPQQQVNGVAETAPADEETVPRQEKEQEKEDEDDSDDEAPEAISNTKQLQDLKDAERKREGARQKYGHYLPITVYFIQSMLTINQ